MEVGDKVLYVPHEIHALGRDIQGRYGWVLGRRVLRQGPDGRNAPAVLELEGKPLEEFLDAMRRHPDPERARAELVLVRPGKPWNAVITALKGEGGEGGEGPADLDVEAVNAGVTLHYAGVPYDPKAAKPHSFHLPKEG